jgi:hypothetical protein
MRAEMGKMAEILDRVAPNWYQETNRLIPEGLKKIPVSQDLKAGYVNALRGNNFNPPRLL